VHEGEEGDWKDWYHLNGFLKGAAVRNDEFNIEVDSTGINGFYAYT